ncbi:MAG: Transcription antitermination protein RfaH [Alphaproteobacteria bacterium MarineAlpha3_Bin5]|nr:transcriptional activator RfaH [Magnetovibrio sp.]PPR76309.1 MAG: Transcription antitermination protein RfaH [Alphaproteobacteria bacterium MarineAlpha3_Bin5]
MTYWCATKTHKNAEDISLQHLLRQGFNVLLPKYLKRRSHARKIDWVPRPLFPGYLFVKVEPHNKSWRAIRSTVGIVDVIRFGTNPAAIPEHVIDEIRARQDSDGLVKTHLGNSFRPGQTVRVLHRALGDLEALFESNNDKNRVTILLNLLGQQVRTTVSKDAIYAAV